MAKWIAVGAMLVEHWVRIVDGDHGTWATVVGRLAFPIFAGLVGYNAVHRSASMWKFAGRLLLWAFAAQFVYGLAFQTTRLNVLFTLATGVLLLACWSGIGSLGVGLLQRRGYPGELVAGLRQDWVDLRIVVAGYSAWVAFRAPVQDAMIDYGYVGMAAVIVGSYLPRWWAWPLLAIVVGAVNLVSWSPASFVFVAASMVGVGVLAMCQRSGVVVPRVAWWAFYAVYPAHLAVFMLFR